MRHLFSCGQVTATVWCVQKERPARRVGAGMGVHELGKTSPEGSPETGGSESGLEATFAIGFGRGVRARVLVVRANPGRRAPVRADRFGRRG